MRTAALAFSELQSLIDPAKVGAGWYDNQLPQSAPGIPTVPFPCIVVQRISAPRQYTLTRRLNTFWARYQFTIWGGQFSAGSEARRTVRTALMDFVDSLNLYGVTNIPANAGYIVGDRDALYPITDGPVFQQLIDAMLFVDETL